jgi:lipid-A-disaccharide synthase-like uncharacterized protein
MPSPSAWPQLCGYTQASLVLLYFLSTHLKKYTHSTANGPVRWRVVGGCGFLSVGFFFFGLVSPDSVLVISNACSMFIYLYIARIYVHQKMITLPHPFIKIKSLIRMMMILPRRGRIIIALPTA